MRHNARGAPRGRHSGRPPIRGWGNPQRGTGGIPRKGSAPSLALVRPSRRRPQTNQAVVAVHVRGRSAELTATRSPYGVGRGVTGADLGRFATASEAVALAVRHLPADLAPIALGG